MTDKLLTDKRQDRKHLLLLFVYTAIVVFFCSKMSPFYPFQEWSDVNLYFNIGKTFMNGQTLYSESFDHKGPFIFLIYGIGYLISNDTFFGMFLIQILVWSCIVACAYCISKLFLNKTFAFFTAVFFLPMFISHTSEGGSAEEFIAACMAISLYFFLKYFKQGGKHSQTNMYIHGLMWGIVFLIKFNLTIFWIFPLLAIGLMLIRAKEYKNLIQNILIFILGGATFIIPFLIYFISRNALQEAMDIYFFMNSSFRIGGFIEVIQKLAISFYQRLRFEPFEFVIILIGAFVFPFAYLKNNIARASIILCFLSVFSMVFIGGYIYYYSIPYYLFAILGIIVIIDLLSRFITLKKEWILVTLALVIGIAISISRKDFFGKYATNKQETVVEAFLPIIMEEKEDRSLINLGLDDANALFTYGNIMPNVKYFVAPNLPYEAYPQLRDEQTKYTEEKKTKFIVLAEYTINAQHFLDLRTLNENYEVVAKYKEYYSWHNVDRYFYLYKRKEQ